MIGNLFLKLSGKKKLFNLNFSLLRFFNSMVFGSLWNFKSNGELEAIRIISGQIEIRTFFDVGANVGDYFREVSKILSFTAVDFHLFEPSESTYLKLASSTDSISTARLNKLALGSSIDPGKEFFAKKTHTLSGFYSSAGIDVDAELVSMITLDHYCEQLGLETIDFLKIDVEGHELEVLKGAKNILSKNGIRIIQFEFGINSIEARVYFKDFYDLLGRDYDLYIILSGGMQLIDRYYFELESFGKVSNYLAVLKSLKLDLSK